MCSNLAWQINHTKVAFMVHLLAHEHQDNCLVNNETYMHKHVIMHNYAGTSPTSQSMPHSDADPGVEQAS